MTVPHSTASMTPDAGVARPAGDAFGASMLRALRAVAIKLVQLVAGVVAWHLLVKLFNVDPRIVPAPQEVFASLYAQTASGWIFDALWLTLQETMIGFVIGSALGIILAVLLSEFRP